MVLCARGIAWARPHVTFSRARFVLKNRFHAKDIARAPMANVNLWFYEPLKMLIKLGTVASLWAVLIRIMK